METPTIGKIEQLASWSPPWAPPTPPPITPELRAEIRKIVTEELTRKLDERDRKFVERFEKDSNATLYTELFEALRKITDGSKPTQS